MRLPDIKCPLPRAGEGIHQVCAAVMLAQVAVGLLGFYYHTAANLRGPSASLFDNFVYGAPAMAPLLFPNLALLAFIGLWCLRGHLPERLAAESPRTAAGQNGCGGWGFVKAGRKVWRASRTF